MTSDLRSTTFRREREGHWVELQRLLDRVEKGGLRALRPEEVARLPALYRGAVSALGVARAISLDRNVLDYLESLAGRAYLCVYGTRRGLGEAAGEFFGRIFPGAVRRHAPHLALSALLLGLGVAAGLLLVLGDPERYYALVPDAMAQGRTPASSTEELRAVLYGGGGASASGMLTTFAMFLFTNNAKIGMMAFAVGFAAGLPTAFLLFYNGLILGAMAGLYQSRGLGLDFWGWVLPHGVTELGAVVLCGAAGLAVGQALVFPGRRARLDALAERGREAGAIAFGAVSCFFAAGLVEGIFRQLVHSTPVRYAVAAASGAAWLAYFLFAGRGGRR